MAEQNWEEEKKQLSQIALESQAESAIYRDILEHWHERIIEAIQQNDTSVLSALRKAGISPRYLPSEMDAKRWGQYLLDNYRRNSSWLRNAKEALKIISTEVEKLDVEENTSNAEVKKKIIEAIEEGLKEREIVYKK